MNQTHPAASPRLAIATSAGYPDLNSEDQQLCQCLQAQGVMTEVQVWNDPAVDWRQFDAVLIRSIWDYFERYAEYLAWLAHLRDIGLRTINPLKLLRWNSDKAICWNSPRPVWRLPPPLRCRVRNWLPTARL
jgi:hypothetical protein